MHTPLMQPTYYFPRGLLVSAQWCCTIEPAISIFARAQIGRDATSPVPALKYSLPLDLWAPDPTTVTTSLVIIVIDPGMSAGFQTSISTYTWLAV
jgi:hypothetical protein